MRLTTSIIKEKRSTEDKSREKITDINKVYMYHSKTLGGIFREKKTTDSSRDGWTGVRREEKFKSPLGSVMCSGRKFAGKEDINVG